MLDPARSFALCSLSALRFLLALSATCSDLLQHLPRLTRTSPAQDPGPDHTTSRRVDRTSNRDRTCSTGVDNTVGPEGPVDPEGRSVLGHTVLRRAITCDYKTSNRLLRLRRRLKHKHKLRRKLKLRRRRRLKPRFRRKSRRPNKSKFNPKDFLPAHLSYSTISLNISITHHHPPPPPFREV